MPPLSGVSFVRTGQELPLWTPPFESSRGLYGIRIEVSDYSGRLG